MKTAVIIPSRYGSSRFPGKPLALIKGKPLILRVLERVGKCKNTDFFAVATDDRRIFEAVKKFGYNAFMTPKNCKSGTDRIAFVASKFLKNYGIFINVQGDEPLIDPALIDKLSSEMKKNKKLEFITAAYPLKKDEDIKNPNIVKVVFDKVGYALYFSRFPVPYNRDSAKIKYYKHMGIYGYKKDFLTDFTKSRPSVLEKAECLEQLRALENGKKIKVVIAKKDSAGVDTPHDVLRVERMLGG
ncbi:MAG: 3-deoxy-manno-octulosonate cytidylyltransferase [Endomicrobia bacterium]|nr:3-deoxy-manno-octulosonate cytidylyltransferase [Endomicrobiia bacterium]MCL2799972.1 3-deoxy-manno-octulosonate cytidylyltransferase [Endomicrobiia bacterium]